MANSFNIRGVPFKTHGAINVSDAKTAEEVITKAGLDWEVSKCEVVARMPVYNNEDISNSPVEEGSFVRGSEIFRNLPNAFATYRTDKNIPLGYVKNGYTPVQNRDAFKFFNDAIGENKAKWETAGFFGNGERIFVSAKLPDNISVKGDDIENYLVFTTSHDGSTGVKILFTPIRVVCQNTLNAAIKSSTNYVTFKHTKNVHNNINAATEILGISKKKTEELNQIYNMFANTRMDDKEAYDTFAKVILDEGEQYAVTKNGYSFTDIINKTWGAIHYSGVSMRKVNAMADMAEYYTSGIGQKAIQGTAWGVYNAITGYYANVASFKGENNMDTILYGRTADSMKLAADILIEKVNSVKHSNFMVM